MAAVTNLENNIKPLVSLISSHIQYIIINSRCTVFSEFKYTGGKTLSSREYNLFAKFNMAAVTNHKNNIILVNA